MFFLAFDEVFQLFGPEWGARRNCGHPRPVREMVAAMAKFHFVCL